MIVLTTTGCTGSPSVAMSTSGCPWTVSCAGQTDASELIIRNLYLLPGVMVNVSNGVLVLNLVLRSCNQKNPAGRRENKKRVLAVPGRGGDDERVERAHRELSFAVDQQRLGVLSRVGGQSAGESLHRVLVKPVGQQHHVRGQIVIVQVAVGVLRRRLSHYETAVDTVDLLQS